MRKRLHYLMVAPLFCFFFPFLAHAQNLQNVLVEQYTGAGFLFDPDGHVILEQVIAANPNNIIPLSIHSADDMQNADGLTLQTFYSGTFPAATFNRTGGAVSRSTWPLEAALHLANSPDATVDILNVSYDANSRQLTATVRTNFINATNGDFRLNIYISEDHVSGTGPGYDQANFFDTQAGHTYFGAGNPIIGYDHRYVFRAAVDGPWGITGTIPSSPSAGSDYSKALSYTLPATFDEYEIYIIGILQRFDGSALNQRAIVNAARVHLISAAQPNCLVEAGANLSICEGDTVQLNAIDTFTNDLVQYSWSPATGLSNPAIQNPTAFPTVTTSYQVMISDSSGCTAFDSVTITVSPVTALTVNLLAVDADCFGSSDGAVIGTYSGGSGNYVFLWNTGATSGFLLNIPAGTYSVTVDDLSGCATGTGSVDVNQSPAISTNLAVTNTSSAGANDGAIDLTTSGGIAPYTYSWNSGASSEDLSGLVAGIYSVTIGDANGCPTEDSATVKDFCPKTDTLFTSHITSHSAHLNWQPDTAAVAHEIRGGVIGGSNIVNITIAGGNVSAKPVFGLWNNNTYVWQIRAHCDLSGSHFSQWAAPDTFTTGCFVPANPIAAPVLSVAARLSWNKVGGSQGYNIRIREPGTAWTDLVVNGPTKQFKDVRTNPQTLYEWKMRTICNSINFIYSDWTVTDSFTTPDNNRLSFGRKASGFRLNPNPAKDFVVLSILPDENSQTHLRIFDLTGMLIKEFERATTRPFKIDLTEFNNGVYLVEVKSTATKLRQTLLINK